jgi:hypothetical protein
MLSVYTRHYLSVAAPQPNATDTEGHLRHERRGSVQEIAFR